MEHFLEILLHALKDTAPLLLWVFLIYALIELLDSKTNLQKGNRLNGKLGPVIGSATGLIPQCGFSVMAAKLYEKKYITVGTLLAIFFSTSDEAFLIMLADGTGALWVLPTIAVKMAVGIAVGYAIDGILKAVGKGQEIATAPEKGNETPRSVKDIFLKQYEEEKEVQVVCGCGKTHGGDSAWSKYLWYPLLHTLQVAAFIFLVNFVLTAIIHTVGEENFASFMQSSKFLQPFLTSAIGLIPNCASSVVLTETFLSGISAGGGITFGSFVAGLCANAGMGYVVLLKNTKKWKRNLLLIACSYLVSVAVGLLINLLPIA
jgi:hypothetical protein